jgi:ParB-like chromosome segregation protein Spo0J
MEKSKKTIDSAKTMQKSCSRIKGEEITLIKIHKDKLFHLEGNPRQAVEKNASDKLRKLIKGHGFRGVLEVFKNSAGKYEILCGNHRFDAGVLEGLTEFPCQEFNGTRAAALARAVSDNKSNEWTAWTIPELKDIFTEIDDGSFDMELTGFDQDEIAGFFDNEPGSGDNQGGGEEKEKCPECGQILKE